MNFKIGTKEILREIEKGNVEKIVVASNAPEHIKQKISAAASKNNVRVEINGDEIQLATSVGKPFPIASVAYCKHS